MLFSKLKFTLGLDLSLLLAFCALESVSFTGVIVHEWLGLLIAGMVVVHLLLSWPWIAATTKRLLVGGFGRSFLNYLLNFALFGSTVVVIFSGIMISQDAIPALTGNRPGLAAIGVRWISIHDQISDVVLILAGLHLAMNWDWSLAVARTLLRRSKAEA